MDETNKIYVDRYDYIKIHNWLKDNDIKVTIQEVRRERRFFGFNHDGWSSTTVYGWNGEPPSDLVGYNIIFENIQDAVHFKLVWAGEYD